MPFILCLIGLSGSGKTTIANALQKKLIQKKIQSQILDGDILRKELGNLFGYSYEERMKQNQVVQVITNYLIKNNINCIISIVAPYDKMRKNMRAFFGDNYIQCFLNCDIKICAERDVKGYYKKAKKNLLNNFNGINDIYELPNDSELIIDTNKLNIEDSVNHILTYLESKQLF